MKRVQEGIQVDAAMKHRRTERRTNSEILHKTDSRGHFAQTTHGWLHEDDIEESQLFDNGVAKAGKEPLQSFLTVAKRISNEAVIEWRRGAFSVNEALFWAIKN